jgi:pimeloyl-ACP methyl ester carboxylesterase
MMHINGHHDIEEVTLTSGVIRYRDTGAGMPIVFVHGLLVNGNLWRKVVTELAPNFRCIVPDLPLGSHPYPMGPDADLTPPALAHLIAEFLAALDLHEVILVGNDTGGALCQLVITQQPERIGRLVLTNCDAFDNFLPLFFRPLQWAAHIPGFVFVMAQALRLHFFRTSPIALGWLVKYPVEASIVESYVRPVIANARIRRDFTKVLKGISARYTLEAAAKFGDFRRSVLLAWAEEDRFFTMRYAKQLRSSFPMAQLRLISDSATFVPEDQPEVLAQLIQAFISDTEEISVPITSDHVGASGQSN